MLDSPAHRTNYIEYVPCYKTLVLSDWQKRPAGKDKPGKKPAVKVKKEKIKKDPAAPKRALTVRQLPQAPAATSCPSARHPVAAKCGGLEAGRQHAAMLHAQPLVVGGSRAAHTVCAPRRATRPAPCPSH